MAAKDRLSSANERTLELVTSVQERILEATKSYVSAVSGVVPETPSWLPSPPEDLPSAKDLLEETFKFQAQLLEANRNFSLALAEAWEEREKPAQKATKASKSTKPRASTKK
jgi:Lhr-like helicase